MDRLTIVTTTYYPNTEQGNERYKQFRECMQSWLYGLIYDKGLGIHVADDGSEINIKYSSHQKRKGIGASLNTGFKKTFENSPIAMYIVDDFMLDCEININPYVELLKNNEHIGMVRIGPPHPDLTGTVKLFNEGWALVLNRHNYAYSMRPAIYHKRFFDAYGWFDEGISCWECERLYNERFCASQGPEIVYALPNPWEHIDVLPLGQIEPEGR